MVSLDAKAAFVHNAPVLEHWDSATQSEHHSWNSD